MNLFCYIYISSAFTYIINMNKLCIVLLCTVILHVGTSQSCGGSSQSDQLHSGSYSLTRQNPNLPRYHTYTVNVDSFLVTNVGFEVAVSTQSINGYNPNSGIDYKVNGGKQAQGNALILVVNINQDNSWTSMRVSYLVSNRNQLFAGNFVADPFDSTISSGNYNGQATFDHYLPKHRFSQQYNYQVETFISGFRTQDNSFGVYIRDKDIDTTQGRLVVQIQTNANPPIQFLQISYIIYPTNHPEFSFSSSGSASTYSFEGPQFFQNRAVTNTKILICKKGNTQQCPSDQVFISGACRCNTGRIQVNGACRVLCAANAYFDNFNRCVCLPDYSFNFQGICTKSDECGQNQVSLGVGRCACKNGFLRAPNGQCIANCNANQIFNGTVCVCRQNFIRNNQGICSPAPSCNTNQEYSINQRSCVCKQNYFRDVFGRCVLPVVCKVNQVLNTRTNQCECRNGYTRDNRGICIVQPTCKQNQVLNQQTNQCICINGFIKNNRDICIPQRTCGQNQVLNTQTNVCVCRNGYVQDNRGICIPQPTCKQNQVLNQQTNQCICINGYIKNNRDICIPQRTCGQNQVLNTQTNLCRCRNGYVQDNRGICIPRPTCGQNQVLNTQTYQCVCRNGYTRNNRGICIIIPPVCTQGQVFNSQTNQCECKNGFIKFGSICVNQCAINQVYVNGQCQCKEGTAWISGACRQCPANSYPNNNKDTCICSSSQQIFISNRLLCQNCPQNQIPNTPRTQCICRQGYSRNSQTNTCQIIRNCPANAQPNNSGICICNNGFYLVGNQCKPVPTCPSRSTWNQQELRCICDDVNRYLINNQCQTCGTNENWDGSECVCRPQTFRISGVCRTCDPKTTYNGADCICNIGFYGNRDNCSPCHSSCGRCSGPGANQCLSCVDISYTLLDGYCSRNTPCQIGTYLGSQGVCEPCIQNCRECDSGDRCRVCAPGFEVMQQTFGSQVFSFCEAICGDGRKNHLEECDDGNRRNNDGCNSNCLVQDGWFCNNGSSISSSRCTQDIPTKSEIILKGAVNGVGRVLQSVRLSYIPPCLTQNQCADCFRIIKISVNAAAVPITPIVNYVPNSGGQFLVQFKFQDLFITSAFTFTARINDDLPDQYKGCFTEQDLQQRVTKTIDPATLVIAPQSDNNNVLTLDDIFASPSQNQQIQYTDEILDLLNQQE